MTPSQSFDRSLRLFDIFLKTDITQAWQTFLPLQYLEINWIFMFLNFFQSLMDSFDYHSNILLSFENRAEKNLPLVPPAKLEEMTRRFVTVPFHKRPAQA